MSTKLKFTTNSHSLFLATLRGRVDAYFTQRALSPHANGAMWAKALFFLLGYALIYGLILANQFGAGTMLALAVTLGVFAACIGFNVSHDALHGAFSAHRWVNSLLGGSFYLLGASPYVWKISHNLVHHTFTNIPGHDEDIEVAPGLVRLNLEQPLRPWQRYQQWYTFPLYALISLSWVLHKDYVKFYQDRIGQHPTPSHPRREHVKLFSAKGLYYIFFLGLPIALLLSTLVAGTGRFYGHASGRRAGIRSCFPGSPCRRGGELPDTERKRGHVRFVGDSPVAYDGQLCPPLSPGGFCLWRVEPPD